MLADTPARITDVTADQTPEQLRTAPGPGAWSAVDVLAHLRACADVWGGYIDLILAEDHPSIRPVNPTTWIKQTDYREQAFRPSLEAFTAQRAGLLAVLAALSPADWSRALTATWAGKSRERTVHSYAEWLANHEQQHIKQIARLKTAA
jgi:uncharacterized damage-inducible protein DinB